MRSLAALLFVVLACAGTARADILFPLGILTEPAHPSSNERFGVHVIGENFYALRGPSGVTRATVQNGLIDLEIIETSEPQHFPGYRPVGDLAFDVAAWVGPLPAGVYGIRIFVSAEIDGEVMRLFDTGYGEVAVSDVPLGTVLLPVYEYYSPTRDRYRLASDPTEIAAFDSGTDPGWSRTGQQFYAYVNNRSDNRGRGVCQYVSPPGTGLDARFISISAECVLLIGNPVWVQNDYPFELAAPDTLTGECPPMTVSLYRLWNPRTGDHRWVVDGALRARLVAQGWVSDGYGDLGVAMCAPSS
jgi:hypothetical protein